MGDRDAAVGKQCDQDALAEAQAVDAERRERDQESDRDADGEHGPTQVHADRASGHAQREQVKAPSRGADQQ